MSAEKATPTERILAETAATESPRVQEAREDTAATVQEYGVNQAIEEGIRRYDEVIGTADDEQAAG
jgi:hypothetical protein